MLAADAKESKHSIVTNLQVEKTEKFIKDFVRTRSGRPAQLIGEAEDEFETVGILEYSTGDVAVRRRASWQANEDEENCRLGKCDVYSRFFGNNYGIGDIAHMISRPHLRADCPDGKDCLKHYRLNIGAFDLINLGHSCIYAHHGRNWTNKFIDGFTYFEELPNGDGVRDPVLQYCHQFNEAMFEDPYCEDFKEQNATERFQELLIEFRDNEFNRILKTPENEHMVTRLKDFMQNCEYLKKLNNPLEMYHVVALSLLIDTPLLFEINNRAFLEEKHCLNDKWKHIFCVLMEATDILARIDPLVGQNIHCSMPGNFKMNTTQCAINNFIVASKKREIAAQRFPDQEKTLIDIYVPHRHHKTNDASICFQVCDVSWLSRFPDEELVLIAPGQCVLTNSNSSVASGEEPTLGADVISTILQGNTHVRDGKDTESPFIDEITICFSQPSN